MAEILWEGSACECCRLVIANGDDSGCRDYYGHTHTAPTLPDRVKRQLSEVRPDMSYSWDSYLVNAEDPDAEDGDYSEGFCDLCDSFDGYQTVYPVAVIA